jgi:asparagine synthase (glutamine-hydrolysing)
MRRALKGIVPEEILERRRKARVIRGPLVAIQNARKRIDLLLADALICDRGFIEPTRLREALDRTDRGSDTKSWQALMRAVALELWLKGATHATA